MNKIDFKTKIEKLNNIEYYMSIENAIIDYLTTEILKDVNLLSLSDESLKLELNNIGGYSV